MRSTIMTTAILLLSACASMNPPPELVDARAAYQRAASAPGAALAQTDLYEARQALGRAEASFSDVGSKQPTRDLAYVAERKAQAARARASALASVEQIRNAQLERERIEDQRAAATRMQLDRAKESIEKKEDVIAAERQARAAADSAKEDERGLVLTLGSTVLFGPSEATLVPAAQERLEKIAEAVAKTDRPVTIIGHTDSTGSTEKNEALSRERADAVRTFLVAHGVPEDHVRSEGVGATQPIADEKTAAGRATNRRVEIIIGKKE